MDFDWKSLVRTVAPTIATALGGPLAGLATRAVAGAVLGKEDATEDEVAAALAAATPEQMLALKKADQEFAVRMRELDIDIEALHKADRSSAREREVQTGDHFTPRTLALGVTFGFFGVLGWMLYHGVPPGSEALYIMLGSLGTAWSGIVAYYFGSSAGSAAKNALVERMGAK